MVLPFSLIGILLAYSIFISRRYSREKREAATKTLKIEKEAQEADVILQNVNAYFILIDSDFIVLRTNYYLLNRIPEDTSVKRVGDLLRCKNAVESGECGTHARCKICGIRAVINRAFRREEDFNRAEASMLMIGRDGQQVLPCDVSVSGRFLKTEGKNRMVLTVYDISELKNMQRLWQIEKENALSCEKLKATFIANMSHEIRTPLNAIVGFSALLASTSEEEEKNVYIDIVNKNNERLLQIINDILDLSQIEAGTTDFVCAEFNTDELLHELNELFKMRLREKPEIGLVCDIEVQQLAICSDRQRIIQVFANLMNNAMKFTRQGNIQFGCRMMNDKEVCFYVKDTGIGIPEEEKNKIFNRFTKLDREVPGTGLGLSLSQSIIEKLGGRIGVNSEVNEGSTFWFTLPLNA